MNAKSILRTTLSVGTTAVQVANNIGGVPLLGVAAAILDEIGQACDQVLINKRQCKALYYHSRLILEVLQSQPLSLTDERLRGAADEFEMILHKVLENIRTWASWGILRAFLKRNDISKGLTRALDDFTMYQTKFDIQVKFTTVHHLQGIRDVQEVQRQDSLEIRSALEHILTEQKNVQTLLQMQQQGEPAAQEVMRVAQTELRSFSIDTPAYDQYSKFVLQLYESTGTMPAVSNISHEIRQIGSIVTAGMHSEIYKGLWLNNVEVALKTLRSVIVTPSLILKFQHEIEIWHKLKHPNILQFLGVVDNMGPHLCMVSPWQANGNALTYTKMNPRVDRLELLIGAARGVEYLHCLQKPIIHGNLRCSNILVSNQGTALISDFGLSRAVEDLAELPSYSTTTATADDGCRWCAPELMTESPAILASDVYAFAMSILECLISDKPFNHIRRDLQVVLEVSKKMKPRRPVGEVWDRYFSERLWSFLELCWNADSRLRPNMTGVSQELQSLHIDSQAPIHI